MQSGLWLGILLFAVIFVVVRLLLRSIRSSSRRHFANPDQPFLGGRAGETVVAIPRSSAFLNAELKRAADSQMTPSQSAQTNDILRAVAASRYESAIGGVNRLLAETNLHEDVKVLLLWVKSNVYQRTGESELEVGLLKDLCAIRAHCLFELNLGNACSRLEMYTEAETHFLSALSLSNGNYPLASYNLGILYCRALRKQDAISQLRALESIGKDVPKGLIEKLKLRISEIRE